MKRSLLFIAVITVFFIACKKEHSVPAGPRGKMYKVTFSVSNFAQYRASFSFAQHGLAVRQRNLADSPVSLDSYLDVLYYLVFDSQGNFIKTIKQDSTLCSQFGIITDSLPAGTYQIRMAAGKQGMTSVVGSGTPNHDIIDSYFSYGGGFAWQDAFYAGFTITVSGSPVNRNVTLNRVISRFELHLEDSIPQSASTIGLSLTPEFWNLSYNQGVLPVSTTGGGKDSVVYTIPASAKGHAGYTLDRYVSDTYGYYPTYVVITCRDASNNIIVQKVIGGLFFTVNQRTILSGKLFQNSSAPPGQSFTVKVDTAWGTNTTQQVFSVTRH